MQKKDFRICFIAVLLTAGIGFFVGYETGSKKEVQSQGGGKTFYATVTGIEDHGFHVEGMEINDINFRGEFLFQVEEDTELVWRSTAMELSEFDVGDHIAVTCTGIILSADPGIIEKVTVVQLLDDEK